MDIGQPKIEDDQGRVLRQQLERDLAIGSFEDVVALRIQSHSEKLADRWFVINNKHLNLVGTHAAVSNGSAPAGMGNLIVNRAPPRSPRLVAAIVPCKASMKPREIASPRPVPGRTWSPFCAR